MPGMEGETGGSMLPNPNPANQEEEDTAYGKAKKMFGFYELQYQAEYDTFNKSYERSKEIIARQGSAPLTPVMTKVFTSLLITIDKHWHSCEAMAELLNRYCMEARDKDPHAAKNVARWKEHISGR